MPATVSPMATTTTLAAETPAAVMAAGPVPATAPTVVPAGYAPALPAGFQPAPGYVVPVGYTNPVYYDGATPFGYGGGAPVGAPARLGGRRR